MDNSNFKSSEELGVTDDPLFMARLSNSLQLEPFPTYQRSRVGLSVYMLGISSAASVLVWLLWPTLFEIGGLWLDQVESNMGISVSILLGLIGLVALLVAEVGSDQIGEVF